MADTKETNNVMQACTALAVLVIVLVVLYFLNMWNPMMMQSFTPEQRMSSEQLYQWTKLGMAMNPNNPENSFELRRHSVVPLSQNDYQLRSMDGKRYAVVYEKGVLKDGDMIRDARIYWPNPAAAPHELVVALDKKETMHPDKFNMHASMVPLTAGNEVRVPRKYRSGRTVKGYADMMPYAMVREGLKNDKKATPVNS